MSKVWLFVGGVEVTSKKTKETFQLKPSQTVSVGKVQREVTFVRK